MTDIELLNLHLERGDDEAFAQLVRRHAGWVHGMARRRLRDSTVADDVTQAVFILLHRKRPNVPSDRALVRWLHRSAWYATEVAARAARRRKTHEAEAAMIREADRASEEDRMMWEQLAPLLDELVGRLRRRDREAILLRYYRQMTFTEVAAALETTEEAARKRVDRAIEKLRAMAAGKGLGAGAAASLAGVMDHQMNASAPAGVVASAAGAALARSGGVAGSSIPIAKGAMNMMVWAKAKVAASIFVAGAITVGGAAFVTAQTATTSRGPSTAKALPWSEYPKLAPFTAFRWNGSKAEVQVESDVWYELVALNDVPAADIVAFAKEKYDSRWQKRVVEDLVEVMDQMKRPIAPVVNLKVRDLATDETRDLRDVSLTHEKRQMLWDARQKEDERAAATRPASGAAK